MAVSESASSNAWARRSTARRFTAGKRQFTGNARKRFETSLSGQVARFHARELVDSALKGIGGTTGIPAIPSAGIAETK
eukprot:3139530-Rhodomonas_salina.1